MDENHKGVTEKIKSIQNYKKWPENQEKKVFLSFEDNHTKGGRPQMKTTAEKDNFKENKLNERRTHKNTK